MSRTCTTCKRDFPNHLVHVFHDGSAVGPLRHLCPLCALIERNAAHGLPPDTPFGGQEAQRLHAEALELVTKRAMRSKGSS